MIWSYWEQGGTPPDLVSLCLSSWKVKNPEYELRVLDSSSLGNWTDIHRKVPHWGELPVQKRSNLLRLDLLEKYGGVWVDATLYCLQPLSKWLRVDRVSGFSVFDLPREKNRLFASFFIAAEAGNPFIRRWHNRHQEFFSNRPRQMRYSRKKYLIKAWPFLWTRWGAPLLTFGVFCRRWGYPYFIFHFLATRELFFHPDSMYRWLRRSRTRCSFISSTSIDNQVETVGELVVSEASTALKLSNRRHLSDAAFDVHQNALTT